MSDKHLRLHKNIDRAKIVFILFVSSASAYLFTQVYLSSLFFDPFRDLLNMILFFCPVFCLYCITGNAFLPILMQHLFNVVMIVFNLYIIRFRGNMLMPWDLYSIAAAKSVASRYDYTPDLTIASIIVLTAVLLIFVYIQLKPLKNIRLFERKRSRAAAAAVSIVILFSCLYVIAFTDLIDFMKSPFDQKIASAHNGVCVNFISRIRDMKLEAPEGYDEAEAEALLDEEIPASRRPNIICVMCEAFCDPAVHGPIRSDQDYMPFIRSLLGGAGDTVSGTMYASCYAGNTAVTEYEFLTGNAELFFPGSVTAYQQYIHPDTDLSYALPAYLKNLGYRTLAAHPNEGTGYNRSAVYQAFGFDEIIFEDGYGEDAERVRGLISDRSAVRKLIQKYEEKEEGMPVFEFCVTIQNHSPYADDDPMIEELGKAGFQIEEIYKYDFDRIEADGANKSLNNYLNLVYLTDCAVKELVEYFDSQEEDTVIVFFGDHQPSEDVFASIEGAEEGETVEFIKVPFFIHANFDIEESSGVEISSFLLQNMLLDISGAGMNGYQSFLRKVRSSHPAVTILGEIKNGKVIGENPDDEILDLYKKLWYFQVTKKYGEK